MKCSEEKIWGHLKNLAIFACILLSILFSFFPQNLNGFFLGGAILLTAFFGLPHGALDFKLLQSLWLKKQIPYAVTCYTGLFIFTVFLWSLSPTAMLAVFLLMSSYHFGGDYPVTIPQRFLTGFILIGLPCFFHPNQVEDIFNILLGHGDGYRFVNSLQLAGLIGAFYLSFLLLFNKIKIRQSLELVALGYFAYVTHPLIYFVTYFCLFHSLKHYSEISILLDHAKLTKLFIWSLPATITTLVLALGFLYFFIQIENKSLEVSVLQITFIGLSALTVPHMILVERVRNKYKL